MFRFGDLLKAYREASELSQTELAAKSGIPVGTIRDYEQHRRDPTWRRLQKLATALGKTPNDFLPDVAAERATKKKGRPNK